MSEFELEGHTFDELVELARTDPERLEALRRKAIDELVDRAPDRLKPRLESLQWRIDAERSLAANPTDSMLRVTAMMWDRVIGEGGLVDALQALGNRTADARPRSSASILRFMREPNSSTSDEPGAS